MANNLGSLVVSLGLDAGEFTKGMTKAEYQAQQFARNLERGVEAARVAAIGSMAAIGGAVLALDKQLQSIAGFQDLADKIGDSAQEVASLQLAADLSGVSLDNIASASVKLTTALSKLGDEGEGAGKALTAIGLDVAEFKQLSPVAQIDAVAQALAGYEDGASKTAVAVALFGKSGADLIPLFNDLAEQGGRQVTLTGEQITAADEYSKALTKLTSEVRTLVSATAADAAPAMTEMVRMLQDVKDYATDGAGGFSLLTLALDTAKTAMQTIVVIGSDVAYVFKQTGVEIGGMAAQVAALASLDIKGFNAISEAMKEDAARARKELDDFQKRILLNPAQASFSNEGRNANPKKQLAFSGAAGGKVGTPVKDTALADFDRAVEANRKELQGLKELSKEQKFLDDVTAGRYKNMTAAQIDSLRLQEREIDNAIKMKAIDKELLDAQEKQAEREKRDDEDKLKITEQLKKADEDRVKSLVAATPNAKFKDYIKDVELLEAAWTAGAISADEYREAVGTLAGENKLNENLKESKSLAEELGLSFTSAFEDAIVSGGAFSDVLKGLEKDIARLIVRKQVTDPLAKAVQGIDFGGLLGGLFGGGTSAGIGGSAGPLGSFSSFAGGGYTGDGARAGGLDGQGGYLAMLHPQESVVDHAQGQGMGGTSINQSITIDARGADAGVTERIMQAMRQTKAETLAAVQAQANRGGSFARAVGRA